jgi:uncharacterized protein YecA (UPF0149 family)
MAQHKWQAGCVWDLSDEQAAAVAQGASMGDIGLDIPEVALFECAACCLSYENAVGFPCRPQVVPIARNRPCPCGSGRKYKRCHGRGR